MARIILALCLLISSVVSAQPGYTNINSRYKWIAGGFDSSLILPRYNGVPSGLRSAWNTDGQLAVDTANNRLYVYSGGAWVRVANYSDVGSTYTFPYSVVAPGSAIQLENDTTANPANYFYGRNSAGRRGWYPQSGISIPISSLTAATRVNDINNGDFGQTWRWNSLSGDGLKLSSIGTNAGVTQRVLMVEAAGTNSSSSRTTHAGYFGNIHTGTSSINRAITAESSGGSVNYGIYSGADGNNATNYGIVGAAIGSGTTTNIAAQFIANNGTNNYAIIVPASSGSVGIGTSTPSSKAILDLTSTTQGALMPRMNTTQQNAISSPATGLIIWNTDSLALVNYTGSAWLKVSQGGGGITNADNGLVKNSSGFVGLDSNGVNPLTRVVEINANNNQFIIDQATNLELTGIYSYLYGAAYSELRTPHSFIRVKSDSILIEPRLGKLKIDTLNYTLSTTGKKILVRDTATGLVENIDPALIGGGGSGGITVGTTTITSGTNGRIGYNNSGVYGEKAVTGTGDVVLATSPTITTPVIASIVNTGTQTVPTVTGTLVQYVVNSTTSSGTPAPTGDARDNRYNLTALATAPTFSAPSGTATDGNTLLIRVKDDGTARALAWNGIYRGGTQLALPTTTTISKTIYIQFVYNFADTKWDLTGVTNGL